MLQEVELILGQPSPQNDTYIHDADVQQLLVELWAVANTTDNWQSTAYATCALLDLINTANGSEEGELQDDLRCLVGVAMARGGRRVWPRHRVTGEAA